MKFSEGLLRARGQIVFILALALSMAIIIRLEALSTEERIQAEVAQRLEAEIVDKSREEEALRVLAASQAAFNETPDADTVANVLVSLVAAVRSGGLMRSEAEERAAQLLRELPEGASASVPNSVMLLVEIEMPGMAALRR